jgi:poly-gamma-glutamate capsule biosynthesis protein CapA/YwtB (metallophosphatase superfamily)
VVVVLAHWGVEYRATPTSAQRSKAKAILAAGADLIIGSHSHWAGAIGASVGGLIFYSLGDLVFDLARSEETLEGILVEITFSGTRVVQVELHPTLIVDLVQPNLLEPADASGVLERMRNASTETLAW